MEREQAINIIKSATTYTPEEMEVLKVLVPELAESEDERIIDGFHTLLKGIRRDGGLTLNKVPLDKCEEWLEKQKEQKPVMIQWTGKNLKEVIDFTGKSPKFGEWFKSWEDFENYVHSHGDILKLFCEDGSHYEVPTGSWIVKTPNGYNVPSVAKFVQKPAEWSEEDEALIDNVCTSLRGYALHERKIDLDEHACRLENMADKLKSLRPHPHWKPSEEQMEALERLAKYPFDNDELSLANREHLAELVLQLKKLM